jgi:Coenzyme PQQ synthesis protein D (PqqD)
MTTDTTRPDYLSLLTARVKVPQHVVYRTFPSETVILNLETGKYHGLNATAGRMLEAIDSAASVGEAAATVAADYDGSRDVVERDVCLLCQLLLERDLIEVDDAPA